MLHRDLTGNDLHANKLHADTHSDDGTDSLGLGFNVRAFGAVGDGVVDDTAAITNTIAALPASGGVIVFPCGIYRITSTITVNKRCRIIGATKAQYWEGNAPVTILKDGNFTGITVTTDGVIIDGICVNGAAGNGGDGIQIKNASCTLQHVTAAHQGGVGIRIGIDEVIYGNICYWRLIDVDCNGNASHGLFVDTQDTEMNANAGIATGLFCNNNGGDGLRIGRAILNNFEGTLCEANVGAGIHLMVGAEDNAFWNPDAESNTAEDILFDLGSSNNLLVGFSYARLTDNSNARNLILTDNAFTFAAPILIPRWIIGDGVENLLSANQSDAEVGTTGMYSNGTLTRTTTTGEFYGGVAGFKVVATAEGNLNLLNDNPSIPIIANASYCFSVYAKASTIAKQWRLTLWWKNASHADISQVYSIVSLASTSFTRLFMMAKAPATATEVNFMVTLASANMGDILYGDNLMLEQMYPFVARL